jgi:glycosyltransferase involved in cell wall biosynthesis
MRICHVITRLIIGGAQENTILTCRGLAEHGHEVVLVSGPETGPEGSLRDRAASGGYELVTIDALRRAVNPLRDWRARSELCRLFERLRPDVVHTHSSKAGILGRAAAARVGIPIVVHTIHGMSFNRTQPMGVRILYRCLERWAGRWTGAFISVADAMTRQAVAAGLGSPEQLVTIRSGVEAERFRPQPELRAKYRRAWGVGSDDVVVGTIARLFKNKGYDEIISAMPDAVSRAPRLRFVWIGDGAQRGEYLDRLARLGLRERVHLAGLIPPEEVASQINGFDIVLHASRWEGLPRAVVQGLLTGVPAISFDNDGAPEVVIPDQTGILVPLGDTEKLADAVVTLAGDPDMRRRLGERGRARCIEEFDWRLMVAQIEELYEKLRAGKS